MSYFGELRTNWRPLAAATAGLSAGLSLSAYTNAAMGPRFLAEFGWDRADFVLTGTITLLTFVFLPVYGRLTDLFGVRRIAVVGVVGLPLCWAGYALMSGPIWQYFAINVVLIGLGVATTPAIYSRIVATCFDKARGLALAIAISGPPLLGAVGAPALEVINNAHGWRTGCLAIAATIAVIGALALVLLPAEDPSVRRTRGEGKTGHDYRLIGRTRVFWILLIGVLLCNLYHTVTTSQLGVVLGDSLSGPGTNGSLIAALISVFATAVIVGRFVCGVALDRFPAQRVAAVAMALPGVGCLLVASPWDGFAVLVVAVCCLGAAWGAEGDVIAYLVARRFDLTLYSTVLSILSAAIGVSSALGAFILSRTLQFSDSFNGFLVFAGVAAFVGGALFLALGRQTAVTQTAEPVAQSPGAS
ncbi:MFS transporter [Mycolicibacterium diernhoferi]|uniref:MFS transporter n=1 Tax=Mycolicibacterium diernhoferi TaxID=1801 RepID=A0A1Q4HJN4_9MYCO|nr:MFS transporter [Mycolicibacterium diernhoferi]OJZ67734.1 MFS transporter [Mycolicibacterium diernhoferi]OPE54653.1 MFS transporter [Mycolicibacterium diernhoferi]PEG51696.1 MFS transporter [Mycolicibacterium diernhoferi]QYL20381.1 MFS transporter [Mycolicibacterium diernhoferi]